MPIRHAEYNLSGSQDIFKSVSDRIWPSGAPQCLGNAQYDVTTHVPPSTSREFAFESGKKFGVDYAAYAVWIETMIAIAAKESR